MKDPREGTEVIGETGREKAEVEKEETEVTGVRGLKGLTGRKEGLIQISQGSISTWDQKIM